MNEKVYKKTEGMKDMTENEMEFPYYRIKYAPRDY